MDNKYEWNLKELFIDEDAIEKAINDVNAGIEKLKSFKGKLASGVDEIYNCYKCMIDILEVHEKLYAYAMLQYHKDMSKQESIKFYKRIERLSTDFSEAESFVSPEISKIPDEILEEYLKDPRMIEFEKSIRDIMKEKKHILSEEVENVLAQYSEIFASAENTFDIFTNTEFEFSPIKDDDGNELKMNAALYSKYLTNKSENIRKQAFESMYALYKKHINTITELYLTRVKSRVISSKLRNYKSSLDAATNHDDSNEALHLKVYDILLHLNHH